MRSVENVLISSNLADLIANFDMPAVDAAIWERKKVVNFFKDLAISRTTSLRFSQTAKYLAEIKQRGFEEITQDLNLIKNTYCRLLPGSIDDLKLNYDLEVQIRPNSYTVTPTWHTDRLGVIRVLVNYSGQGTEWVPQSAIRGEVYDKKAIQNEQIDQAKINQVPANSVIFIKCPEYFSRKNITSKQKAANRLGFVHRTPSIAPDEKRLLIVLGYHNLVILKEPRAVGINNKIDYYYFSNIY